ncbi:MAG TPA: hypothetical protein VMT86_15750 [Bryobacteraceae bacterium]|nr:hypothetical protein [Bryobacteraceae bacterium]
MTRLHGGRLCAIVMIICGLAGALAAQTSYTYTASGVFAAAPVSGADELKLAGEPFSITITASDSQLSSYHGPTYAGYTGLQFMGNLHSGLLPTPVALASKATWIVMANGNPNYNLFDLGTTLKVIGLTLKVSAVITLPAGTLTTVRNHAFPAVSVTPASATMTYSDGTNATTLGITGTLYGAASSSVASSAKVYLHGNGVRAITLHADGTQSERAVSNAPVDLGSASGVVALRFYAAGVSAAADVRVQIAGQDVPVLYAGASGNYPGLDEIGVQLPRSLAGMGKVDVVLWVDGQSAGPVQITIR